MIGDLNRTLACIDLILGGIGTGLFLVATGMWYFTVWGDSTSLLGSSWPYQDTDDLFELGPGYGASMLAALLLAIGTIFSSFGLCFNSTRKRMRTREITGGCSERRESIGHV